MIRPDKLQPALRALSFLLTRARWMAHEVRMAEVAELLDAVEILPSYLAQPEDVTDNVRAVLQAISQQFAECSHVVEEFEREDASISSA